MAGGCSLDLRAAAEMVDEICDFTDKLNFQGSDCPSKKLCVDCGTSKTPLWRGGPAGPKSLCNACGIRSRKKRWALLQISEKKMKRTVVDTNTNGSICNSTSSSSSNGGEGNSSDSSSKDKLMAMWEVLKPVNVNIEELNEEQKAAVLLMALSHGFNYS